MCLLALVLWMSMNAEVRVPATPLRRFLSLGWGSAPEAALQKFPKMLRRNANSICLPEQGSETCLLYVDQRLETIRCTFSTPIEDGLAPIQEQLGRPMRVMIKPDYVSYCWQQKGYDMTVVQRVGSASSSMGQTVAHEYRTPSACAQRDGGT